MHSSCSSRAFTAARSVTGTTWTAAAGSPVSASTRPDDGRQRPVGVESLGAAAQDDGVAGLEAQPGGIHGHVRARLVDDADHPQRDPHARDLEPVRPDPARTEAAHGVGQLGDLAQPAGHGGDGGLRDGEAVDQGGRKSRAPGGLHVLLIFSPNGVRLPHDLIGHSAAAPGFSARM